MGVGFSGRVVILGFGTIGQCALPLLMDRLGLSVRDLQVVDRVSEADFGALPGASNIAYARREITPENLNASLDGLVRAGDLLLNLSVGVDSVELADWCQSRGALYLDTAIEPWEGFVEDADRPVGERTEYALHQRARKVAKGWTRDGPTALLTHGANPGLVSHFAKAGLIEVARGLGIGFEAPTRAADWAGLARQTGTRVIHISERDTQISSRPRVPGEFVNTWSIAGFIEEAMMPVEIGWGTHEEKLPPRAGRHAEGPGNAIFLRRAAANFFLYSWVPSHGQILGMSLPHSESVTISDFLSLRDGEGRVVYRPTVTFVYLPCDDALASLHETMMGGWQEPERQRVIGREIEDGADELGVLLLGHGLNGLWYGSRLDIGQARRIVPHSNPTALQVAAGVVSGALWAVRNPRAGFREPESLPHEEILADARPYLGDVESVVTDWTPLQQRRFLFGEPAVPEDPWQFENFRL